MKLIKDDYDNLYFVIGDRRWPAANSFTEDYDMNNKKLTHDGYLRSRGCLIQFETGWSVSIIWGNLTYSSNRNPNMFGPDPEFSEEPTLVEILVMNYKGKTWGDDPWDTVLGWVDENEMIYLLDLLNELPTTAEFSYSMIREL